MNTTRRLFAVSLISLATMGTAQAWSWSIGGSQRIEGNGDITQEARDVGAFESLSLAGSFKVQVRQGSTDKVEIKADRNLLPYLETKVVDGSKGRTLEISTKRGYSLRSGSAPVVLVEVRQLRGVAIAGSGDVRVDAMKTSGPVEARIAGSGDIRFADLTAESVGVRVAGSGDVVLAGKAGALNVSVSGSGDIKARDLVVDDAKISIAGSGDVTVQATKRLDVSIAGSGDVGYVGNPEVSTSKAGGGKIRKLN